jgi:uncharacterized OsmC-like protein
MDASELRELQRPLKQRYRDEPASARTPAHSEGIVDVASLTCRIIGPPGDHVAGLHPAAGGTGELACSADLLLDALVACAGVTLAAVATSMGIGVRTARISADGWWDARGTLGVDRETPVGLTDITLHVSLDTDADAVTVARLVELTERYCVVAQTLAAPPGLVVTSGVASGE